MVTPEARLQYRLRVNRVPKVQAVVYVLFTWGGIARLEVSLYRDDRVYLWLALEVNETCLMIGMHGSQ